MSGDEQLTLWDEVASYQAAQADAGCTNCGGYHHAEVPTECRCVPPPEPDEELNRIVLACPQCGRLAEPGETKCNDPQHGAYQNMTRRKQLAINL